jgi:hypothetical protein
MLGHMGYRSLWPAVFFLPWLVVGAAYLLEAMWQEGPRAIAVRAPLSVPRVPLRWLFAAVLVGWGVLGAALTSVARADGAAPSIGSCEVAAPQEARVLADALYDKGEYQRAAACYDAAGDALRAQRAYLKAVGPSAEDTARKLKDQSNAAKALFTQVQGAFHATH